MINYPAVSADWQTLTGSRPTMCLLAGLLHHGFFSPISRSNNNLSSRLIKSSRWRLLLLFFFLTFAEFLSTTRTPVTQVLTIPVGESLCGLWEPPPGPPHPAAGGLKLRPRSLDAPTQTQTTTQTCHESTYVVYTGNQTSGRKGAHGRFFPPTSSRLFLNKHSCRGRCAAGDAKNASGLNVCRVNHSNCHRNDFCNVHFCGVNLDGVVMPQ